MSISWSTTNHYTYDDLYRVTEHAVTNKISQPQWVHYEYGYDIINNQTNMNVTLSGEEVNYTYAYDELNRMTSLGFEGFNQTIYANYSYNPNGKQNQTLVTNDTTLVNRTRYAYDSEQRLDTIISSNATARILSLDYTYNNAQQISSITEILNGSSDQYDYLYDKRHQLTREIQDSVYKTEFTYDNAQNRTRRKIYDPNETLTDDGTYAYVAANKMTNFTNNSSSSDQLYRRPDPPVRPYWHYYYYHYDQAGNLTQRVVNAVANGYTYNAQNKLTQVLGNGFTNEFRYDSGNRRVAVSNDTWKYYIHVGNIPIAEVDANANVTRWFIRGIGMAEGTGDVLAEIVPTGTTETVHFYLSNHRGDTLMTLTDNGTVGTTLKYDAFGNKEEQNGDFTPRYTFSTKEYLSDAVLYLYAYRVYDPIAGRWTQRDPIDYQDSENLYQFCGNNPVNSVDPNGRWIREVVEAIPIIGTIINAYPSNPPGSLSTDYDITGDINSQASAFVAGAAASGMFHDLFDLGFGLATLATVWGPAISWSDGIIDGLLTLEDYDKIAEGANQARIMQDLINMHLESKGEQTGLGYDKNAYETPDIIKKWKSVRKEAKRNKDIQTQTGRENEE